MWSGFDPRHFRVFSESIDLIVYFSRLVYTETTQTQRRDHSPHLSPATGVPEQHVGATVRHGDAWVTDAMEFCVDYISKFVQVPKAQVSLEVQG